LYYYKHTVIACIYNPKWNFVTKIVVFMTKQDFNSIYSLLLTISVCVWVIFWFTWLLLHLCVK